MRAFYYVAIGEEQPEKVLHASIVFQLPWKRTEARKWILIHPFRRARRGEKLTRRETQENLERNSHSQFRLSKRRLNIICCILNIVLLFTHAIVLGQCAISVYICSAFSLLLPFPFIFCGSVKINNFIAGGAKKMRYAYRDNAVVERSGMYSKNGPPDV